MQEDALKWNERYKNGFMPFEPSAFLELASPYIKQCFPSLLNTQSHSPKRDSQQSKSLTAHSHTQDSHHTRPIALDIACGNGRNAKFLAQLGFDVDGIDISSVALEHPANIPHITPILADLDSFNLKTCHYDIVLDSFFLDRRLFPAIIKALKPQALLLFETFIHIDSHKPKDDRALYFGELEEVFSNKKGFHILYHHIYESKDEDSHRRAIYPHIVQFIAKYH